MEGKSRGRKGKGKERKGERRGREVTADGKEREGREENDFPPPTMQKLSSATAPPPLLNFPYFVY